MLSYDGQLVDDARLVVTGDEEAQHACEDKASMLPGDITLGSVALSVALSVVYRHFRSRRLKVHINRATEELGQCVHLLNRLPYSPRR